MSSVDGPFAWAFNALGLPADADERSVRQAYARQLKQIDQATQIEAFQALRRAYEVALDAARRSVEARGPAPFPEADIPTASEWATKPFLEDLAGKLDAGIASASDAMRLLRQALERLDSLDDRARFEQWVVGQLALGWQPGHEFLLDAACTSYCG